MTDTPKAQQGIWKLIAPDGREWWGESPLTIVAMEQRERVPEEVAVERILDSLGYTAKHADAEPDTVKDALEQTWDEATKKAQEECMYAGRCEHPEEECGTECPDFVKLPF